VQHNIVLRRITMNVSRLALSLALVGLAVAPWLTLVPQADAADAKAKCRVGANPARVQIAVAANGLAAGTAQFQVMAGGNASSVLTNAVDALGDAAAEWDSAIAVGDVAEGTRGTIDATFVAAGGIVTATVSQGGAVVATASAKCSAK